MTIIGLIELISIERLLPL